MIPSGDLSLAFICRLCEHMARAKEQGRDQCNQPCGGPSKMLAFPCYQGQIERTYLAKFCYLCGKNASKTLDVGGRGKLGMCETHAKDLTTLTT